MQVMQHFSQREGWLFVSALWRPVQPFGHSNWDLTEQVDETRASSPRQFGFLRKSPMLRRLPVSWPHWNKAAAAAAAPFLIHSKSFVRKLSKYKVQLHAARVVLLAYSRAKQTCGVAQRKLQFRSSRTARFVRSFVHVTVLFPRLCSVLIR